MAATNVDNETEKDLESKFPCSLTIRIPFPTARLASTALQVIEVDRELSPLVYRSFALSERQNDPAESAGQVKEETVLVTYYRATTNRMLRVAVNGFLESVGTVVSCMRELDVDVVDNEWIGDGIAKVDELDRVQGLEERGEI